VLHSVIATPGDKNGSRRDPSPQRQNWEKAPKRSTKQPKGAGRPCAPARSEGETSWQKKLGLRTRKNLRPRQPPFFARYWPDDGEKKKRGPIDVEEYFSPVFRRKTETSRKLRGNQRPLGNEGEKMNRGGFTGDSESSGDTSRNGCRLDAYSKGEGDGHNLRSNFEGWDPTNESGSRRRTNVVHSLATLEQEQEINQYQGKPFPGVTLVLADQGGGGKDKASQNHREGVRCSATKPLAGEGPGEKRKDHRRKAKSLVKLSGGVFEITGSRSNSNINLPFPAKETERKTRVQDDNGGLPIEGGEAGQGELGRLVHHFWPREGEIAIT